MDWWVRNPDFTSQPALAPAAKVPALPPHEEIAALKQRIAELERITA
jgi:hypothetical protein